jgi:hypothetical protein
MTAPSVSSRSRRLVAFGILFGAGLALTAPNPAQAFKDWTIDPDTGLVCVSSDCTYVRPPNNNKCICKKVWPNNNRREALRLDCVQKSGGGWVPCQRRSS